MTPDEALVVVVGSLNVDHVVAVDKLPLPGETVLSSGYMIVPGGKGLNQAVTAARQGVPVTMVARTGDDSAGSLLGRVLAGEGVVTTRIVVVPGAATGTALITVASDGENTIVVAPGANATLAEHDITAAALELRSAAIVLAQMEIPAAAVEAAFGIAHEGGAVTVLNPSPVPERLDAHLLSLTDVIVANRGEAEALTGEPVPERAASRLFELVSRAVVVTLGPSGALVLDGTAADPVRVPSFAVDAVDATAAGDAFSGALAAGLARGLSLPDAVRRGCAAGALAATRMGALPSLPSSDDVDGMVTSAHA